MLRLIDPSYRVARILLLGAFLVFFVFSQLLTATLLARPFYQPRWYTEIQPNGMDSVNDFQQYYEAGDLGKSPLRFQCYDPNVQLDWHNRLVAPVKMTAVFYNQDPPFLHFFCIPLSFLPYNQAYVVWCVTSFVAALACVNMLAKSRGLSGRARIFLLCGFAASAPTYLVFFHGQITFWLIALISLFLVNWFKEKDWWAGSFLALCAIKPQYLLALLIPALAQRRVKVLSAFALTGVALTAVAIATVGLDNVINYPKIVVWAESVADSAQTQPPIVGVYPQMMVSVRGWLSNLMEHHLAFKIASSVFFASLLALFLVWRKAPLAKLQISGDLGRWLVALTIVLALVTSAHTHIHDCAILIVVAALTVDVFSFAEAFQLENVLDKLWTLTFLSYPPLTYSLKFMLWRNQELGAFLISLINIVLLVLVVLQVRRKMAGTAGGE